MITTKALSAGEAKLEAEGRLLGQKGKGQAG